MSNGDDLRRELGELDVLGQLDEDEAGELLGMFRAARRTQNKALDGAIDEVLGHLPRLVRMPARKIVFG